MEESWVHWSVLIWGFWMGHEGKHPKWDINQQGVVYCVPKVSTEFGCFDRVNTQIYGSWCPTMFEATCDYRACPDDFLLRKVLCPFVFFRVDLCFLPIFFGSVTGPSWSMFCSNLVVASELQVFQDLVGLHIQAARTRTLWGIKYVKLENHP